MNLKKAVVTGNKSLRKKLEKMDADMRKEATKALQGVAMKIANTAKLKIRNPPKTGTVYGKARDVKKFNWSLPGATAASKRIHQASATGEAPANDTGHLMNSINVTTDNSKVLATVTVKADYGLALEFGTRDMGERPFLRPSIEENKHLLPGGIKNAFAISKPKKG
jgi:HK97 gp10 family phage protein